MLRFLFATVLAAALVGGPHPAGAQSFWGNGLDTTSGERMLVYHAYVGDRPDASYPYVIYAATRDRPDGYFWFMFRNGCAGQSDFGASWGFVPWNGGGQQGLDMFDRLPAGHRQAVPHVIQCDGVKGTGPVEGRDAMFAELRAWQNDGP